MLTTEQHEKCVPLFSGIAIGSWIAGGLVQFIGASATFKLFGWFASFMFVFHYTIQKAL